MWHGGSVYCTLSGFLDFTLATLYPVILVLFAIVLYTRNFYRAPVDDLGLPMDEVDFDDVINGSQVHHGSRAPSVANSYRQQQQSYSRTPQKPPSISGSVDGR